mgnify:CR=1 FL=1|tara:strand:- start:576 stop:917 length:342 start_codon:yes stop_codon:yes gene_type:complete
MGWVKKEKKKKSFAEDLNAGKAKRTTLKRGVERPRQAEPQRTDSTDRDPDGEQAYMPTANERNVTNSNSNQSGFSTFATALSYMTMTTSYSEVTEEDLEDDYTERDAVVDTES